MNMRNKPLLPCVMAALLASGCFGGHARRERKSSDFLDDKVTAARVQTALGTNYPGVHVTVHNGVAQLSGSVRTPDQKDRVTVLARSVDRVKEVKTDVQVQVGRAVISDQ